MTSKIEALQKKVHELEQKKDVELEKDHKIFLSIVEKIFDHNVTPEVLAGILLEAHQMLSTDPKKSAAWLQAGESFLHLHHESHAHQRDLKTRETHTKIHQKNSIADEKNK
jgi:hypothetical protein